MIRLTQILVLLAALLLSTAAYAADSVPFDGTSVAQLLGSAGFAAACTALIRRAWPAIDGLWVWLVAGLLAVGSAVLARHAAEIPPVVWEILGPVAALVLSVGGVQLAQSVAAKGGTTKNVTVVDTSVIAERDTDPEPKP